MLEESGAEIKAQAFKESGWTDHICLMLVGNNGERVALDDITVTQRPKKEEAEDASESVVVVEEVISFPQFLQWVSNETFKYNFNNTVIEAKLRYQIEDLKLLFDKNKDGGELTLKF